MSLFAEYQPDHASQRLTGDAITVRPAVGSDLSALARLTAARQEISLSAAQRSWERRLAQDNSSSLVLVAEVGGELAGFGSLAYFEGGGAQPENTVPDGWYLTGVVVGPPHRRRGIGHALTRARLEWIAQRASRAHFVANAQNRATIDLHAAFGFEEVTRDFTYPGVEFTGGVGILFRVAWNAQSDVQPNATQDT